MSWLRRSITLVRNDAGLLPLRPAADARIAAIMPQPRDLTPADTSMTVPPALADSLARHHPGVSSFVTGHPPTDAEIASLVNAASDFDLIVVGTISASLDPGQADLVRALRATGTPLVWVALRTPWDLVGRPGRANLPLHVRHPPAVAGRAGGCALRRRSRCREAAGQRSAGLYERGHGLTGAGTRMSLRDEIGEQPQVAARLMDGQRAAVDEIARSLATRRIAGVMIAARGTSDHAAIYAQYLFGAFHALPVALATPALFSVYRRPPHLPDWLVIGISQSGASPDVVAVIESARKDGSATLAITNVPDSDLGHAADWVVDLSAGPERAVAATKTYTSELLAIAMLSCAMDVVDGPARTQALAGVPAAIEAALGAEPAVEEAAATRGGMDQCVVLGRGYEYATAREWALKLKELAQIGADPYSAADFQHGPLALVEPGYPVLAVATRGPDAPGHDRAAPQAAR